MELDASVGLNLCTPATPFLEPFVYLSNCYLKQFWFTVNCPLGKSCIKISIKIPNFIQEEMHMKELFVKWFPLCSRLNRLIHWDRVTHICDSKLTIIDVDNDLSPVRRKANIRTNAGVLLNGTQGTNVNEILIEIHTFPFRKIHFKMSSGKWWPFCLGLNVFDVR